jgi:hypothetical protein
MKIRNLNTNICVEIFYIFLCDKQCVSLLIFFEVFTLSLNFRKLRYTKFLYLTVLRVSCTRIILLSPIIQSNLLILARIIY